MNDIVIGSTGQWVDLRAEREGRGNGRVYAIQLSATDASGNAGTATFEVQVPDDYGGQSVKDAVAATVTLDAAAVGTLLTGGGSSSLPDGIVRPARVIWTLPASRGKRNLLP